MTRDPRFKAVAVRSPRGARVTHIDWGDGHKGVYPHDVLRGYCPCAGCQGHFTGFKRFIENVSTELTGLEPVGNYAARLTWGDGHSSGIYAFAYLHELAAGPPDIGPTNQDCLAQNATH